LEEGNTGEPGGVDEACACPVGRRGAPWEREGGGEVPGAVERRGNFFYFLILFNLIY
jgi:hypothetical protein